MDLCTLVVGRYQRGYRKNIFSSPLESTMRDDSKKAMLSISDIFMDSLGIPKMIGTQ